MTEDVGSQPPSFVRQLFVCGTIFTLSMSIGAGAGFSGVVIPQVIDSDTCDQKYFYLA